MAHVRDIPRGAGARLSPRWGLAWGFASVGEGLALLVVSWLLAGYSEVSCLCRGDFIQEEGEGRLGAGRDAGRSIPYI